MGDGDACWRGLTREGEVVYPCCSTRLRLFLTGPTSPPANATSRPTRNTQLSTHSSQPSRCSHTTMAPTDGQTIFKVQLPVRPRLPSLMASFPVRPRTAGSPSTRCASFFRPRVENHADSGVGTRPGCARAIQIIKLTGLDKLQCTRVLEREVQKGEHEKGSTKASLSAVVSPPVSHSLTSLLPRIGPSHLGTLIFLERGLLLAKQYNCDH